MGRLALVLMVTLLSAASSTAVATTCIGPYDLERWAQALTAQATFVFVARITAVVKVPSERYGSADAAVLKIDSALKGSPTFDRVVSGRVEAGYHFRVGDVRVFFIDEKQTIVNCSDYPGRTTNQIVRAVRRASNAGAT